MTGNVRSLCGSFTRKHIMIMGSQNKRLIWNVIRINHWQFHGGHSSGFLSVTWDLKSVIKTNISIQTLLYSSHKYRLMTIFYLSLIRQKLLRTSLKSDKIRFIDLMPWGRHLRRAIKYFSVKGEICKVKLLLKDPGKPKGSGDQCCTGCGCQGRIMRNGD